ncbi:odorant-binding protein 59a [Lycorma delicatula]|uniref:odorant-binding protein 59a n=1 Tax=Lycorma delicatula TaxID=130591 RepID=UPI003F519FDF
MNMMYKGQKNQYTWFYLVIAGLCAAAVIEALKCRVADEKIQQDFNDVVRSCMSSIHGSPKDNGRGNGGGGERYENRYNPNHKGALYSNRKSYNTGNHQQNNKKESYDASEDDDSNESSYSRSTGGTGGHFNSNRNTGFRNPFDQSGRRQNRNNTSNSSKHVTASPLEDIDPCIVHCVFRQMQMLDGDSKPDKSGIVAVMTQKIRNPELKEFIQDSIMDCFEIIESGMRADEKCEFSKQFALCLEEKGKQNCEDWDEDKKSNSKQQSTNKSNQNMKQNNQYRG